MNDQRETNPYESPHHVGLPSQSHSNLSGRVGFALSLIGFGGLAMVVGAEVIANLGAPFSTIIGMCGFFISFLSLPGLILSIVGLFRVPRGLAGWGFLLGLVGSSNLPTLITAFVIHSR